MFDDCSNNEIPNTDVNIQCMSSRTTKSKKRKQTSNMVVCITNYGKTSNLI